MTTMPELPGRGLYDPADERDACGFGLISTIGGDASRAIVDGALQALSRMAHRGGIAPDGLSGDGCGVLLYGADACIAELASEAGLLFEGDGTRPSIDLVAAAAAAPQASIPTGGLPGSAISQKPSPPIPFMWG